MCFASPAPRRGRPTRGPAARRRPPGDKSLFSGLDKSLFSVGLDKSLFSGLDKSPLSVGLDKFTVGLDKSVFSGIIQRIDTLPADFHWNCPVDFHWNCPTYFRFVSSGCNLRGHTARPHPQKSDSINIIKLNT